MKKNKLTKTDIRECLWFRFGKLYIRLRDTNKFGYGKCISSGRRLYRTEGQAGHFIPRGSCQYLYYDEDNVNLQSYSDNVGKYGNILWYEDGLIKKIGKEKVDKLKKDKNKTKQWKEYELIELINKYRNKVYELKKTKTKKVQQEIDEYIKKNEKKKWYKLYLENNE